MRGLQAQLSLAAVAFLLGMLLVVQLLAHTRPSEVTGMSAQELSELIETLSSANAQLRVAVADLRNQARDYAAAEAQGESLREVGLADLERVTAFAGQAAVRGQGISMEVSGGIDAVGLNDLINELRNAGAEAIAVEEVRITARSVAVANDDGGGIRIDGAEIATPLTIRAIGHPEGLIAALQRPGGIVAQLEQFIRATIVLRAEERMELPATALDLVPGIAAPIE